LTAGKDSLRQRNLIPLLFCGGRGEGREKQGQNEKAIIIITVFTKMSTKTPYKIISKGPFSVTIYFLTTEWRIKTVWLYQNDDFERDLVTG